MTEADETAVLVIGSGPVGTTLAMDLARLGVAGISARQPLQVAATASSEVPQTASAGAEIDVP